MFINIDKLLALLLTFSPSKVGLQAAQRWPSLDLLSAYSPDSEHPDQLNMTRANTHNRERSENQCLVTRGDTRDTHYGQQDTVLCIMDRVPGTSGIPREKRMRRNEKLIVISDWVCHELNVNIGQSEASQQSRWANRRSKFLKKIQQSKSKITWIETVEHQSMFYKMHSNLWAMRQKKACASLGVHLWTLWDVQRQEIKEDQLMAGLRFMIISCLDAWPGLVRAIWDKQL